MKDKIIYTLIAIALIAVFVVPLNMWATHMNLETGLKITCSGPGADETCYKDIYRIPAEYGDDLDTYLAENPDAEPETHEAITRY